MSELGQVAGVVGALGLALAIVAPRAGARVVGLLAAAACWAALAIEVGTWIVYDRLGLASLTVFEVVAFALVFVWLIALVVTTHPTMGHEPAPRRGEVRTLVAKPAFAVGGPARGMAPALVRSS